MNPSKSNNSKSPKDQRNRLNTYAHFSGIAIQMFAIIGIGSFIGVKLDNRYPNNYNIFTIVLSLSSVIISIVFVIRRIIAASKET